MAANDLARRVLTLRQHKYVSECRKTIEHGNSDVLSQLPFGSDVIFGEEEGEESHGTVGTKNGRERNC